MHWDQGGTTSGLPVALYSPYIALYSLSLLYIFLYFLQSAIYALYFHQFLLTGPCTWSWLFQLVTTYNVQLTLDNTWDKLRRMCKAGHQPHLGFARLVLNPVIRPVIIMAPNQVSIEMYISCLMDGQDLLLPSYMSKHIVPNGQKHREMYIITTLANDHWSLRTSKDME